MGHVNRLPLWAILFAVFQTAAPGCADEGAGGADGDTDTDTDSDTDTDTDTDTDADTDTGQDDCVETAAGTFPGSAVEIVWDGDDATQDIGDVSFNPIEGVEGTYVLGEEPMWEAVRFDLLAPATVYGARVQWGNLPAGFPVPATLGAYDDFGSNGFDFYQWESRWEGHRCLNEDNEGTWVDYVFDEPIEVPLPGLFYIAHFFPAAGSPGFMFGETSQDCTPYDGCHSALNLPQADTGQYYNGLTLQFPYDFAVRLVVEMHDTIPAQDKWFQYDDALTAGGHAAWGDYDNDGDDDFMTDGPTLYRNEGDGTFTNVTTPAGLSFVVAPSSGGVFGDYDNDGWLDYAGIGAGNATGDLLIRNNGDGTFTDVTVASGISDLQTDVDCDDTLVDEYSPTAGVAWVDIDADGYLDLYQAQYECGSLYQNYRDRVWHNEGDGTFSDISGTLGFLNSRHAGRGVSPADADQDGDVDVFVSNYRLDPNYYFNNLGDGTVENVAYFTGLIGVNVSGAFGHTIGAAWMDAENDGDFDIVLGNLAHPRFYDFSDKTQIMINDGTGNFTDNAAAAGIYYRETHSNPTVQDFDNDGDQDLFITCVYEGRFSEMYFNNGDATFEQVNYESGAVVHNGWGAAASDFDNDGDVDLIAYDLLRNDTAATGNNWIQVRALGGDGATHTVNAAGLGAVVKATVGSEIRLGQTSGGSGTGCQDSQFLSFGLGPSTTVDSIEVLYPGGDLVTVDGPIDANQRVWVQADGTITYGWTHP